MLFPSSLCFQGADVNFTDCKGHTPLLLATSCGAWKTVNLLLSRGNPTVPVLLKFPHWRNILIVLDVSDPGADLTAKDQSGCNFLHLAILQPRGLRNLPSEVLQVLQTFCEALMVLRDVFTSDSYVEKMV